jgi:hypothetical protein
MSFEDYLQKTYVHHAISRINRQQTSPQRFHKPLTLESLVDDIGQFSPRVSKLLSDKSSTTKSIILSSRENQNTKNSTLSSSKSQQKFVTKEHFSLPIILSSRNRSSVKQLNLDETLAKIPVDISTIKAYRVETRNLEPFNLKNSCTDVSFDSRILTLGSCLAKSVEEISDNIEKATFNHFRMNVKKHELERIVNGSLKLNVKSPIVLQGHHTKKTRSPRNLKFKKNIQINVN